MAPTFVLFNSLDCFNKPAAEHENDSTSKTDECLLLQLNAAGNHCIYADLTAYGQFLCPSDLDEAIQTLTSRQTEDNGNKNAIGKKVSRQLFDKKTHRKSSRIGDQKSSKKIKNQVNNKARVVVKFIKGEVSDHDCLINEKRKAFSCVARPELRQTKTVDSIPTTSVFFESSCPNSKMFNGRCENDDCVWECDICGKTLVCVKTSGSVDNSVSNIFAIQIAKI